MTDPNAAFLGSIPENYDRYLGPVLFEPFARDLARQIETKDATRLLEVACGTGIATRHLRERLPESGRLVATDLSQPMLDYAKWKLEELRGIDWQVADACSLPFADDSFDALVCQFGLMFVPDKLAALKEAKRVLRPSGRLLLSVWDSLEHNTFAKLAHERIGSFFPQDPPTFYQVPFGLHQTDTLTDLMESAGFQQVRIEPVSMRGESPRAHDLARGLVEGNPVGGAIRERGRVTADEVIETVAGVLAREFGDRPVRIPLHAKVATADAGGA